MNITEVFSEFQTQEQAIEFLEATRWKGCPICPYCQSKRVGRHASSDRASMRWQCYDCQRSFSVTVGTIFHGTHISLRNWFLVLSLILGAKKPTSASQIARDLGMRRPTVCSMMHRIRIALANDETQAKFLHDIIRVDKAIDNKLNEEKMRDSSTPVDREIFNFQIRLI